MFPKIAGLIEVLLLSVVYYLIWDQYRVVANDGLFLFRGKLILMMVYAVISFMVFTACDSFNFGNLKFSDIALSQCISVLIVNFITYLQICLILTDMTTPVPMLELTGIDFIVCAVWSWIAKTISRKYCRVEDALLIFGSTQALALKEKMDSRQELYNVTEVVSADEPEEAVCGAIDRHDAVILNDVPAEMRNDILKYAFGKTR